VSVICERGHVVGFCFANRKQNEVCVFEVIDRIYGSVKIVVCDFRVVRPRLVVGNKLMSALCRCKERGEEKECDVLIHRVVCYGIHLYNALLFRILRSMRVLKKPTVDEEVKEEEEKKPHSSMGVMRALTGGKGKRRRHSKKGKAEVTQGPEGDNARDEAEMRLSMTVANIQNHFVADDGHGMRFLDEDDPRSAQFIEDVLFTDVWRPDGIANETAWSAATTSAHIRSYLGAETNEQAKEMGFRPFAAHRSWINDSFATRRGKNEDDAKYDAYRSERLLGKRSEELQIGDMLFRGYDDKEDMRDIKQTADWTYGKFKRHALKAHDSGKRDPILYNSHTDVIVGTGTENGKKYYMLSGGNVNDGYMVKKYFPEDLRKKYKGALVRNKSSKPKG